MDRHVYERMRSLQQTHWWFAGRRAVLSRLIADLPLPRRARLFEAGLGVGGNVPMLRAFGELEGLEPDGPSRDYVLAEYGLAAADGRLPDALPFPPGRFDAVFALDVVEHVEDDAGAVAALGALVAPGGFLVVTVPAYQWMWSAHDVSHHHQRRYTRAELEALMARAGLTCVKASYFNTLLFPLAAAVRFLKRLLKVDSADDALPPAPVNRLMTWLFAAEAGWLRHGALPFGLSVVGIARREAAAAG